MQQHWQRTKCVEITSGSSVCFALVGGIAAAAAAVKPGGGMWLERLLGTRCHSWKGMNCQMNLTLLGE